MAKTNTITLYDLQLASGCTISPFVWATKYALKHKGFEIDLVPGGFTGIMERTGGRSERLPAIVDDGKWVLDSWLIAEYLDEKYPDRPALFGGASMKVLTKFLDGWLWTTAVRPWFGCYIKDYRDLSLPQDHEYVTVLAKLSWGAASSRTCKPGVKIGYRRRPLPWSRSVSFSGRANGSAANNPTMPITGRWRCFCGPRRSPPRRRSPRMIPCAIGSIGVSICTAASGGMRGCIPCLA